MKAPVLFMAASIAVLAAGPAQADGPASESGRPRLANARPIVVAAKSKSPLARVEAANSEAIREPLRSRYLNAVQVYAWVEGGLYQLYAAPGLVSDIALQPGEGLISVAAGDTLRWVIGDTTSGSGASKRTHILVKPASAGLRTNLVLTTDRRVYLVELESISGPAMAAVSWTYPQDELFALKRMQAAAEAAAPVAGDVAVESLNFNYAIEGDQPAWRPIRAFDDGRQVFIEFPPSMPTGEAPPLFVIGSSGSAELVNYRQRGLYYVIDRLFSAAELWLGEKRQQVVRIVRADLSQRRWQGRAS